ncbi:MAG: ABC transporter substrate binding protein, partial [Pseudolabrys sp.]
GLLHGQVGDFLALKKLVQIISGSPEENRDVGASDTQLLSKRKEIAEFMASEKIPALYPFREYANVGGLFIYGANISVLFERAADYLDKLLKGEKIANLPVQQATAFELIVNARTASALGLNLPPNILLRADEVIE